MRAVLRDPAREDAFARIRDSTEDFSAWVRGQQQPAVYDEKEAAGRRVFESTACLNCHATCWDKRHWAFGQTSLNLMSRRTIAAGAAENRPKTCAYGLQNPDAIKTGIVDAGNEVERHELDALVALSGNALRREREWKTKPCHRMS